MKFWKEDLYSGNEVIDSVNMDMCQKAHDLYQAYLDNRVEEEVLTLMKELEDQITYHFICEESIMAFYSYEKLAEHKENHRLFCVDYYNLKNEYLKTKKIKLIKILIFTK